MTAAEPALTLDDQALELLHADVREGYASIATFPGPEGIAWIEILGPRGMRPAGELLVAPVPPLRLWGPSESHLGPLAVAAANDAFDDGLRSIESRATVYLPPPVMIDLAAVLRVVRLASQRPRGRLPTVGPRVRQRGTPSLMAWASCLPLGDLEAALWKSVA